MQTICAPRIGFAGLIRKRLWLPLAPLKAEPARNGDGINEDRLVSVEASGIAKFLQTLVGSPACLDGASGSV